MLRLIRVEAIARSPFGQINYLFPFQILIVVADCWLEVVATSGSG
ncbi:MAG: hypothetical protein SAJ37_13700 [Oscillatoria sp. PMC 1068.18]|nr:hypothetical protein [Oscillatoria sp. PMC 1076.18]MEC4989780.1 hypothetical protein [Oscillatoria sp. PMC 1068.18]